jgi:hypothetical protein
MNKIYALYDNLFIPRYIGKTEKSLRARLSGHMATARAGEKTHKANWVRSLLATGQIPQIAMIEQCADNWADRERFWIAEGRRLGWPLTNGNEGGEAGSKPTEETRRKISLGKLGFRHSDETKRRLRDAHVGRKHTHQHIANMIAGRAGHRHSNVTRQKIGITKLGNKFFAGRSHSQATKDKMSLSKKGKSFTDSHRAALRLAWLRRKAS